MLHHWATCKCMLSCFSHVRLFTTPWTVALQAPLSMRFSRQEYWSGLPWLNLCLLSPALAGGFFTTSTTWEAQQGAIKVKVKLLSCVRLLVTPWTVACQAPLSMEFSRQGYWSGLPFPSPGDLPDPGIEPGSPSLQADALTSEPTSKY